MSGWGCTACENNVHRECGRGTGTLSTFRCCCFGTSEEHTSRLRQDEKAFGDGDGSAPIYEQVAGCRYCAGGEHNLCMIVQGPDGCCCGTAALLADARKNPVGFVAAAKVVETDLEGEEGLENPVAVIQARSATRKVRKGLARLGVGFRVLHCVPVNEGGCGLSVVVAQSSLAALRKAEEDGGRVDVVCDGCIDRYLGMRRAVRRDEELTKDQVREGSRVARILDVKERRN